MNYDFGNAYPISCLVEAVCSEENLNLVLRCSGIDAMRRCYNPVWCDNRAAAKLSKHIVKNDATSCGEGRLDYRT